MNEKQAKKLRQAVRAMGVTFEPYALVQKTIGQHGIIGIVHPKSFRGVYRSLKKATLRRAHAA
jgi:hypothetical protein